MSHRRLSGVSGEKHPDWICTSALLRLLKVPVMTNSTDHLSEKARSWLELRDEDRIRELYGYRWIGYPKAKEILTRLDQLLNRPRVPRMKNLLIVGDTNNGKSEILRRFQSLHPSNDNPEGENIILPVLMLQTPPTPDEGRLYDGILHKLGAPFNRKDAAGKKLHAVSTLFNQIDTRMLILDEIHHVLAGGSSKQRGFCNVIKYIGNELMISIGAAGIDEAFNVFQSDDQLANRFDSMVLPRWTYCDDYLSLLASFETVLPLRHASNLTDEDIATKLLSMSEGLLGELSTILNDATELAISTKKERIDLDLLKELRWQQPSHRKYKTPP